MHGSRIADPIPGPHPDFARPQAPEAGRGPGRRRRVRPDPGPWTQRTNDGVRGGFHHSPLLDFTAPTTCSTTAATITTG